METSFTLFLKKITSALLYVAVFCVPLFFLPVTVETMELNKYFLLYICVFLALLAWISRGVLLKTFVFKRTPLDIPLVVLWCVVLITSIVSQDRYVSFFGDFTLTSINFLSTTAFLIFYFLLVQEVGDIKKVLNFVNTLFIAGFISALFFILRASGLWTSTYGFLPQFNTLNISNGLFGIFLVILCLLSLAVLAVKKQSIGADIFVFLVFLASLAGIVMIGFKILWIIFTVALILLIVFLVSHTSEVRTVWTSVAFALFVAGVLFVLLGVPQFLTAKLPLEVSLGPSTSYGMFKDTITYNARYFLFGSGPSTFAYDFSQFRPSGLNSNFAWNVRFRQPYSSAMEWGMSTGVLGILGFLVILLMGLGLIISTWLKQVVINRKKKNGFAQAGALQDSPLVFWGLTAGWLTLAVAFFVVNFGAAVWLLFWLFLGLMIRAAAHLSKGELPETTISLKTSPQYSIVTSFAFIIVFTCVLVLGIYLGRFYTAEVVYAKALNTSTTGQTGLDRIAQLQKAVKYNPNRVPFYLTAAEAFLIKAQEVANSTKDPNQVAQLVSAAVNAAKAASEKSPQSVATWESLATMYANARGVAPEANNWLISSLERAIILEPTNPTFYIGLGNAKLLERRYSEARDDFEKAVGFKPDMLQGYVLLAATYEAQNNIDKAIETMERGLPIGRNDAMYVFQTGRYYFNRHRDNDWPLSELAWRRSIALNPNYSDALFALALLYERTGNKTPALQLYKRVLELNPGNAQIRNKVDGLGGSESAPAEEQKTSSESDTKKK
ncbi:MAG: tetratricopeptide repeat protein [Candidatus Magasanikbacteria bacterium]|nr:tetratricopeptide repeat protein [Candidatus Magasanikbacteria bacterium]